MKQLGFERYREKITQTLRKNGVKRASLFGSFARGEATKKSDIDLVIEFKGKKSLFDLAGLKIELEESTGRSVDITTFNALHPFLREQILSEQIVLL